MSDKKDFYKGWIELNSNQAGAAADSFQFLDSPAAKGFGGFAGGVTVAAGDVNAHTPEWTNPRIGDPQTPRPDDLAALHGVELDESYAGTHALYQDLTIPC